MRGLFDYLGMTVFTMTNYKGQYVIFHGSRVATVITRAGKNLYIDRKKRKSRTLTEAAYNWLKGEGK